MQRISIARIITLAVVGIFIGGLGVLAYFVLYQVWRAFRPGGI